MTPHTTLNYEAIIAWAAVATAIVTAAAVIVAAAAVFLESRRSRIALGIDLLMKLDERFNGAMRKDRAMGARGLLENRPEDCDDILDFFETLGMLVREGALRDEFVWHYLFHWIRGYWQSAHDYVHRYRGKESTVWQDFERLYRRTIDIEMGKRHCSESDLLLGKDAVHQFLIDEAGE
jgi:hypothetical protein